MLNKLVHDMSTSEYVVSRSVETNIKINKLSGPNNGYYYLVIDKSWVGKAEDFKYMHQGVASTSDILGKFTILTNSLDDGVVNDALKMIGSFEHLQ